MSPFDQNLGHNFSTSRLHHLTSIAQVNVNKRRMSLLRFHGAIEEGGIANKEP